MPEILYQDPKTGNESFLPDGVGERMGFTRVAGYTPPEVAESAESSTTTQLSDAVDLVLRYMEEENPNSEVADQLDQIYRKVLETSQVDEAHLSPGAAELFKQLTDAIETDDKVSATARERISKHISRIQAEVPPVSDAQSAESVDLSATTTTEPSEPSQPGKSDGTSEVV